MTVVLVGPLRGLTASLSTKHFIQSVLNVLHAQSLVGTGKERDLLQIGQVRGGFKQHGQRCRSVNSLKYLSNISFKVLTVEPSKYLIDGGKMIRL